MKAPSPSSDTGTSRRIVVALVVATAAAAVTAGVALNERHPAERPLPRAEAGPALAGDVAAAPSTRRAPLSESASTATSVSDDGRTMPDPSLPDAAEALRSAPLTAGEASPTF